MLEKPGGFPTPRKCIQSGLSAGMRTPKRLQGTFKPLSLMVMVKNSSQVTAHTHLPSDSGCELALSSWQVPFPPQATISSSVLWAY